MTEEDKNRFIEALLAAVGKKKKDLNSVSMGDEIEIKIIKEEEEKKKDEKNNE